MLRPFSPSALALAAALAGAAPAYAQSRGVTVLNAGGETIRSIQIGPTGGGENRLRSTLPPGAQARIGYGSGACTATVRLGYESGRTEDHAVDACTDARVVAGQGQAGPSGAASAAASPPAPALTPTRAKSGSKADTIPTVAKEPPPPVPPWTGKSITKKFGGLD